MFLLAAVAATTMIRHGKQHNRQEEHARVFNLADDHTDALQPKIDSAMLVTHALGAVFRQGYDRSGRCR